MRKVSITLALGLVLVFGLALQAQAITVTDISGDPLGNYKITKVDGHAIEEDYNAQSLIPFPSHDGNAVVDIVGGQNFFFDKRIFVDAADVAGNNPLTLTWKITNTSPFTWSDYHFQVLAGTVTIEDASSDHFKQVLPAPAFPDALVVALNAVGPGSKEISPFPAAPGDFDTLNVVTKFDISGLTAGDNFVIRQIATAVPVPPSAILMGSGLLGLLGLGWRRKVKA